MSSLCRPGSSPASPSRLLPTALGLTWTTIAACLLTLGSSLATAETLTIGGSSAGIGTMRLLATGFAKVAPAVSVVLAPNLGSRGGMKALAPGAIDVAIISRPLSAEEAAQGLVAVEYGKTPFGFVTKMEEARGFKTLAELAEVFGGQRPAWPDQTPVRLVLFPAGDRDTAQLQAFSPAMKQAVQTALARPGIIIRNSDDAIADAIESIPGAMGANTLALISSEGRKLRMLPLNGVVPSPKSLADGSYPYFKTMLLVRKSVGKEAAVRFFDYVASPAGQQILLNSGHWVQSGK